MKNGLYVYISALCCLLLGCDKSDSGLKHNEAGNEEKEYPTRSYVMVYDSIETLYFSVGSAGNKRLLDCIMEPGQSFFYDSEDVRERAVYDELCKQVDDMDFNGVVVNLDFREYAGHRYAANRWKKIDLVSESDYDTDHPAGTSLADITRFFSVSPWRYIRSGYKETYTGCLAEEDRRIIDRFFFRYGNNSPELFPLVGLLSEIDPEELFLLGEDNPEFPCFLLQLDKGPAVPGQYNLTLTCTDTDGNEFAYTGNVKFPVE